MDHQIFCAVRSGVYLNKVIAAAEGAEAFLKPFCVLEASVTAQTREVEALKPPLPGIVTARYKVSSLVDPLKVDINFAELNGIHSAADIDAYNVWHDLIGDGHCCADSAAFACMDIGHYPYLGAGGEFIIAHSPYLLDCFILYDVRITERRAYLSFDLEHFLLLLS